MKGNDLVLPEGINEPSHPRRCTGRVVVYTGFKCNLKCQFCYYLKSIETGHARNYTRKVLERRIRIARRFGKHMVDFTGGEPTLHPDFPDLVAQCRAMGYETVNVISNGWRLADAAYAKQVQDQGLSSVLFSLHSQKEDIHDGLTRVSGSWRRLIQAIENANRFGIRVRLNSVVNSLNCSEVGNLLDFMTRFDVQSVNLILFNPSEQTPGYEGHDAVRIRSYDAIGETLKEFIPRYRDRFGVVNVRFMAFCYVKGLEQHVRTPWQSLYEAEEWDPILLTAFRRGWATAVAGVLAGFAMSRFRRSHLRYGRKSLYDACCEFAHYSIVTVRCRYHPRCGECQLRLICPGLPRDFIHNHPDCEVHPYSSEDMPLVLNPVYFGARYPWKFEGIRDLVRRRGESEG